jgi:hypothetical protein
MPVERASREAGVSVSPSAQSSTLVPGSSPGRARGRSFWRRLGEADGDGFGPPVASGDVDYDALPLVERHDAGALQRRGVDEHVLAAVADDTTFQSAAGAAPNLLGRCLK